MDESPIVSSIIKEYCNKHKLEDKINEAINDTLRKMPDDPYSHLCSIFQTNSLSTVILNDVQIEKTLSADFKNAISIYIVMTYKGNTRRCSSYNLCFNLKVQENLHNYYDQIFQIFESNFHKNLINYSIGQFFSFDKMLKGKYEELSKIDSNSHVIGRLLSNAISTGVYVSQSVIQEISLKNFIINEYKDLIQNDNHSIPKIAFGIFKCGKSMNSKVKFERFLLIINNAKMSKHELSELICKLYGSIRKVMTAGKQGELGMKLNIEGSYIPPNDSLNDVIKLLEEIIKDTGENHKISIGIDCNANNYYSDSTKKYDMDGFKKPPEADELIDWYLKYCSEHPLISYLEDPISDLDLVGWKKFYEKASKSNLSISSKTLIDENIHNLIKLTEHIELEEIVANMSEEEKQRITNDNKIKSEENLKKFHPKNVSFRLGELPIINELFECYKYIKSKLNSHDNKVGITLWDSAVENDQIHIIDFALALRPNMVVLHGINNKNERVNKINRYIELVEELY